MQDKGKRRGYASASIRDQAWCASAMSYASPDKTYTLSHHISSLPSIPSTVTHLLHFIPLCPSRLQACKQIGVVEKGERNTLDSRFLEENPPLDHVVASSHGLASYCCCCGDSCACNVGV